MSAKSCCSEKGSLCQVCCMKPHVNTTKALGVRVCGKDCFQKLKTAVSRDKEFVSALQKKAPLSDSLVAALLTLQDVATDCMAPIETDIYAEKEAELLPSSDLVQIDSDVEQIGAPLSDQDLSDYQKVYFNTDLASPKITIYKDGFAVVVQTSSFPIDQQKQVVRFHEIPQRLLQRFIDLQVGARRLNSVEQRNPLDSFSADDLASIRDLKITAEYENSTGEDSMRTYKGILLAMNSGGYGIFLMNDDLSYTYLPDRPKSVTYPKEVNDVYSDHHELRLSVDLQNGDSSDLLSFQYVEDGVSTLNVYKDLGLEDGKLVGEVTVNRSHSDVTWDDASIVVSDSSLMSSRPELMQNLAVVPRSASMKRSVAPAEFATLSSAPASDSVEFESGSPSAGLVSTKDLVLSDTVRVSRGSKSTTVGEQALVPEGTELTNRNVYQAFSYPPHQPGKTTTYPTVSQAEVYNGGEEVIRSGRFIRVNRSSAFGGSGGSGFLVKTLPEERSRVDTGKQSDLTVRRSQVPTLVEQDGASAQKQRRVDKVTVVVRNSRDGEEEVRLREKGPGKDWYVEESDKNGNPVDGGRRWEFEPPQKIKDIEAEVPKKKEAFLDVDLGALGSKTIYYRIVLVEDVKK